MENIVVLGSLNMDLVMEVERLPKIGETLHGFGIDYFVGGKGANQAVAAARVSKGTVSLIGCVGDDTFGEKIINHLEREPLDVTGVNKQKNMFTGMASIFKTKMDNAIVVIPGANEWLSESMIDHYEQQIKDADVLLVQLEIPLRIVEYAVKKAYDYQTTVVLNPAPYADLPEKLYNYIQYITPNDSEFEGLCGQNFVSNEALEQGMVEWQREHPATRLIVTRGSEGCSYVEEDKVLTIGAKQVQVQDTTGAGDTFNGILCVGLTEGKSISEAIELANAGAGLSTQKFGAQTGMPDRSDLEMFLHSK